MTIKPALIALTLAAALPALLATPAGAADPGSAAGARERAKARYEAYGSCAQSKPFRASRHCRYDAGRRFRATFVFRSHAGKLPLKACFRAYGPKPVGGGHACAKLGRLAYKAYPFRITGVRQRFSVEVTWFVKERPGAGFSPVASSFMKVKP